jgi:hypothetical protein
MGGVELDCTLPPKKLPRELLNMGAKAINARDTIKSMISPEMPKPTGFGRFMGRRNGFMACSEFANRSTNIADLLSVGINCKTVMVAIHAAQRGR